MAEQKKPETEQKKVETVKVELNQAHTHKRKAYKTGDVIPDVRPHVAKRLEQKKIGKIV